MPAALEILTFPIILKTFSSKVLLMRNTSRIEKHEQKRNTNYRLYLFEGLGSFSRRDSPKFEEKSLKTFDLVFMSHVNDLLFAIALKFFRYAKKFQSVP